MAETAAHLIDHVIPRVPVRQWVLSFPIPFRLLFATHPELLVPVLQIVHRVIATFLIRQTGSNTSRALASMSSAAGVAHPLEGEVIRPCPEI